MKMKLNFNATGIKRAALSHGEKVLFGGSFLLLMLFGYSALTREKLPANMEPDRMAAKVEEARNTIKNSQVDPDEDFRFVDYSTVVATSTKSESYPLNDFVLYVPDRESTALRDDPKVFPVEKPLAGAGRGIYSVANAPRAQRRVGPGRGA